jgi:hypothetical protein
MRLRLSNNRFRLPAWRTFVVVATVTSLAMIGLVPARAVSAAPRPASPSAPSCEGYFNSVRCDNPDVYYEFNETTGTIAADSSQSGSDSATYENTPILGVSGAIQSEAGDLAVEDTGTGTIVTTTSVSNLPYGNSSRTLEIWFKTSGSGIGRIQGVLP